jgi:surfeit locus 1 family protein
VVGVRDWSFARRPRWLVSHLFVGSLIVVFVWAGFWQLARLDDRRVQNDAIRDRSTAEPTSLAAALRAVPNRADTYSGLDYRAVVEEGRFVEGEAVRVANRSQDGLGGDWVVGLFETTSGDLLLVNRGFAGRDEPARNVSSDVRTISGWLRISQTKDGFFGATDTGVGDRVPRLDTEAVAARLGRPLAPVWLQLAGEPTGDAPDPVPLPAISEGNHFSYAMQWFIFAVLGTVVYGLVLWRRAGTRPLIFTEV